jgi:hypothetical protein
MISDSEYAQEVAEFLSNKGVTRCPTVCVVPTSASISAADRIALRSYEVTREAAWQTRRRGLQPIISPGGVWQGNSEHVAVAGQPVTGPLAVACAFP